MVASCGVVIVDVYADDVDVVDGDDGDNGVDVGVDVDDDDVVCDIGEVDGIVDVAGGSDGVAVDVVVGSCALCVVFIVVVMLPVVMLLLIMSMRLLTIVVFDIVGIGVAYVAGNGDDVDGVFCIGDGMFAVVGDVGGVALWWRCLYWCRW